MLVLSYRLSRHQILGTAKKQSPHVWHYIFRAGTQALMFCKIYLWDYILLSLNGILKKYLPMVNFGAVAYVAVFLVTGVYMTNWQRELLHKRYTYQSYNVAVQWLLWINRRLTSYTNRTIICNLSYYTRALFLPDPYPIATRLTINYL